jgi:uncharacterized protein with PIN domain/sulfur carrier protein ThiS
VNTADFYFTGDLADFLTRQNSGQAVQLSFAEHQTVKHLIESLGVPHVEVGLVLANGAPVEAGYRPKNGDQIEVRPAPAGCPMEPRFLLDNHLGRLAAYLRMLGFDCLYENDYQDDQIAAVLMADSRILLSRDRRLLMRKVVHYGYCVRSLEPLEQLEEVVRRFDLAGRIHPFRRCLRCNGPLEPVDKETVLDRLEPLTKRYYEEFVFCPACDRVYWKGSHYERMESVISRLLQNNR